MRSESACLISLALCGCKGQDHTTAEQGDGTGCGATEAGSLFCSTESSPPAATALDVTRFHQQWCVVDATGTLICWE